MKQLFQHVRTAGALVTEVPIPKLAVGSLLVHVAASSISAGTERMVVDFAEKNLLQKARARPDLVRQVLDKAQREGILTALQAVQNRLDQPVPLGYSCAGTVIGVGAGVSELQVGDWVACAGGGYAVHAEVVSVPTNLVVKLPENVDFESAAFTTLGAIALQGIRLADVKLGEAVAVIGLGLLGQLTVQMLKAAGCMVIGMDIQPARAQLAHQLGADAVATTPDELSAICYRLSAGHGADAVIITADTPSNQPVQLAGEIARDRGVVVAVGAVGMQIPRKIYYEKELTFRISRSYGPGRYDPEYEEKGHDYPIGYVRWTENRNMQAFVQLLAEGKVNVKPLITHRFPIEEAPKAYDLITGKTGEPFLGVLITYPEDGKGKGEGGHLTDRKVWLRQPTTGPVRQPDQSPRSILQLPFSILHRPSSNLQSPISVGLLGAGNFATTTLLPAMKKVSGIELIGVCTATGLSARHAGDKFGFRYCTTDENEIFSDPHINTVVIATRHYLHARQVLAALGVGKHVFCEKPLALNLEQLREVCKAVGSWKGENGRGKGEEGNVPLSNVHSPFSDVQSLSSILHSPFSPILMVGYNRRFAPMARQLKAFLADVHEPLVMHYRVNAGYIPPDHWVQDPEHGGGRIIGEVCHFVDFLTFLAGALPVRVHARALPNDGRYRDDNVVITLEFADGSLGTITYVANGDKSFPKERVEIFGGGCVGVLDDFRRLELVRNGRKKVHTSRLRQDKGHRGEWEAFVAAVQNGSSSPIPREEIIATTLTTFRIMQALDCGEPVEVRTQDFIASGRA